MLEKYKMYKGHEAIGPCAGDLLWNGVSLAVALVVYMTTFPIQYAAELSWTWIALVYARNMGMMSSIFQGFHWLMYQSEWMNKHKNGKFNPKFPAQKQHDRDRRYTLLSLFINSTIECVLLHLWATKKLSAANDLSMTTIWPNILWIAISPFWREIHFFIQHRTLHTQPLYKWFHAHHHKSYNPGPWSGLSMHPVESITYFTGPIFIAVWAQSPFVWLFANIYSEMASVYRHHGYEEYGGSYYHYIHHARFDCNYGTPFLPLDILFGTWDIGAPKFPKTRPMAS